MAWGEGVEAGEGDADSKDGGLGSGLKFGRDIEILLRRVYSDEIREAVDSGMKVLMSSVRKGMAEVNSLFPNLTALLRVLLSLMTFLSCIFYLMIFIFKRIVRFVLAKFQKRWLVKSKFMLTPWRRRRLS